MSRVRRCIGKGGDLDAEGHPVYLLRLKSLAKEHVKLILF